MTKARMKHLNWHGLYRQGWKKEITPDAFAHPAKFSRGLIRKIYAHLLERGYVQAGDAVLDPFGGVALGALDAMLLGLNWTGCELEQKFVDLGNANIDLWNRRYADKMLRWGTARLVQGDSRRLCGVLEGYAATVSSPPYAEIMHGQHDQQSRDEREAKAGRKLGAGQINHPRDYGSTSGQLGAMKEGSFEASVASPPYKETRVVEYEQPMTERPREGDAGVVRGYGASDGQLSAMREGDYAASVASPPFGRGAEGTVRASKFKDPQAFALEMSKRDRKIPNRHAASAAARLAQLEREDTATYGDDPANLGNLPTGDYRAAVSSPPYEGTPIEKNSASVDRVKQYETYRSQGGGASFEAFCRTQDLHSQGYGASAGQLGGERGDTFWSAARTIVEQVHALLKPQGVAVWVVKDFVRDGKRVPFCDQWQKLCEAVGFETVEIAKAWLVEDNGTQLAMDGNHKRKVTERKSFFRRLAEKKGSPRIDYEVVLFMRKPAI